MAIYRFEAKVHGRAGREGGRSVVASAAYRSGSNLYDDKYEVRHDYSRRTAGVVYSEILAPDNAPSWATDREELWNEVERREDESNRRASAQLAREFIPALPVELSADQRRDLVLGFVKDELVSRGMVADVSIHEPKDGDNHHAHVLCTMRHIDPEGFGKKEREWNDRAQILHWREAWEKHCNTALEEAGISERVDCRSLADQGIDREPQPKLGVAAAAMERKGEHTRRGLVVCWNAFENQIRSAVKEIRGTGEVVQYGTGESWWERAQAAIGLDSESVRGFLHDESSGARRDTSRDPSGPIGSGPTSWVSMEAQRRDRQQGTEKSEEMEYG